MFARHTKMRFWSIFTWATCIWAIILPNPFVIGWVVGGAGMLGVIVWQYANELQVHNESA